MHTTKPKTTAERWSQHLAWRIHEAYGTPKRLASDECLSACWGFILDAETAGDDAKAECSNYLEWLRYARLHQQEEHPPQTAAKACIEIATYAGKAASWSKFRRQKSSALRPKANPYLVDDRPPEAIPTGAELKQFYADIKAVIGGGLTWEIAGRYGLLGRMGGGA